VTLAPSLLLQDYVVAAADCMSFEEGEMEAALHILTSHGGELAPVRRAA
jgi:hypothetical protein